jgi:hypothetical protein
MAKFCAQYGILFHITARGDIFHPNVPLNGLEFETSDLKSSSEHSKFMISSFFSTMMILPFIRQNSLNI